MSTGALVAWARALVEYPAARMEGAWPRAAALIARQALEEALDRFWERTLPPVSAATRSTQLACLGLYLREPGLIMGIRTAWAALSRATHHHIYELAPTAPELDAWISTVEILAARLDQAEAGNPI